MCFICLRWNLQCWSYGMTWEWTNRHTKKTCTWKNVVLILCIIDDIHYHRAKIHKHLIEINIQNPLCTQNAQLNAPNTLNEVSVIVMQTKNLSKCAYDKIPYDVLKKWPGDYHLTEIVSINLWQQFNLFKLEKNYYLPNTSRSNPRQKKRASCTRPFSTKG